MTLLTHVQAGELVPLTVLLVYQKGLHCLAEHLVCGLQMVAMLLQRSDEKLKQSEKALQQSGKAPGQAGKALGQSEKALMK